MQPDNVSLVQALPNTSKYTALDNEEEEEEDPPECWLYWEQDRLLNDWCFTTFVTTVSSMPYFGTSILGLVCAVALVYNNGDDGGKGEESELTPPLLLAAFNVYYIFRWLQLGLVTFYGKTHRCFLKIFVGYFIVVDVIEVITVITTSAVVALHHKLPTTAYHLIFYSEHLVTYMVIACAVTYYQLKKKQQNVQPDDNSPV